MVETKKLYPEKKVIHFVHWSRSGITSLVKNIIKHKSNKYGYALLLLSEDEDFSCFYNNIPDKMQLRVSSNFLKAIIQGLKFYRSFKPHIVHTHSFSPFVLSCCLFINSAKIIHIHSFYPYLYDNSYKSKIKRALLLCFLKTRNVHLVTVSEEIKSYFSYYNVRAKYIMNAVGSQGKTRDCFSVLPPQGRFYTVSRLSKEKNIFLSIDIMKNLVESGYTVTLDIYGEGEEKEKLQDYIDGLGLSDKVRLTGFILEPEFLPPLYDYYISTSLWEGFGLSIVDSLRGGNLVIMSPVGELKNILKDGETAFFINKGAQISALKIAKLLDSSAHYKDHIQASAYRIFFEHFQIERYVREVENLYDEVIRHKHEHEQRRL